MIKAIGGKWLILHAIIIPLFLFSGCGGLPDYAAPHVTSENDSKLFPAIAYRLLTQADFRATNVPDRLGNHAEKLNAYTAVAIRPVPGTKYIIAQGVIYDHPVYHGQIEKLAFKAVMIPDQSWWQPNLARKREGYVLQHEQVHFALMEVAARMLNRQVSQDTSLLSVYESSPDAVKNKLQAIVQSLLDEGQSSALETHTEFDEDTSMRYAPEVQQQWYDKVLADLNNYGEWSWRSVTRSQGDL